MNAPLSTQTSGPTTTEGIAVRRILGGIGLVMFLGYGASAWALDRGTLPTPGPGLFPLGVAVLGCVGAAGMMFTRRTVVTTEGEEPEEWPVGRDLVRVLAVAGLMAVYVAVLPVVGFVIATAGFVAVGLYVYTRRPVVVVALIAAAMSVGAWYLFDRLLGVILP